MPPQPLVVHLHAHLHRLVMPFLPREHLPLQAKCLPFYLLLPSHHNLHQRLLVVPHALVHSLGVEAVVGERGDRDAHRNVLFHLWETPLPQVAVVGVVVARSLVYELVPVPFEPVRGYAEAGCVEQGGGLPRKEGNVVVDELQVVVVAQPDAVAQIDVVDRLDAAAQPGVVVRPHVAVRLDVFVRIDDALPRHVFDLLLDETRMSCDGTPGVEG